MAQTPAPAISRYVDIDNLRLHYLDYSIESLTPAPTKTVLCIHGSAANAHWFDYIARDLGKDYRVLSLDQRGHGDSEWAKDADYSYERYARDLAAVIESLDCDELILVGHSMGGMVALMCAAQTPVGIDKLVIVDTTMKLSPERVSLLRGIGDRPGRSYSSRADYVANYRLRPAGAKEVPDTVKHLAETGCRQFEDGQWRNKFDRKVYASRVGIEGMAYWDQIKIPALYISGQLSDRMDSETVEQIRSHCAQVEFAEVAAANHHVTLDNPQGFTAALTHYLDQFKA